MNQVTRIDRRSTEAPTSTLAELPMGEGEWTEEEEHAFYAEQQDEWAAFDVLMNLDEDMDRAVELVLELSGHLRSLRKNAALLREDEGIGKAASKYDDLNTVIAAKTLLVNRCLRRAGEDLRLFDQE